MIRFVLYACFMNFLVLSLGSGFLGFEIRYSEMMENISVTISARSGTVFLSSMMMQFWQPMWTGLSAKIRDGDKKELILEGSVEAINLALHSIRYLGYCLLIDPSRIFLAEYLYISICVLIFHFF